MRTVSKHFIPTALVIMVLVGCGEVNNEPEVPGRKDCPDFTATIGGVQTRAFDRQWESGDAIGISGAKRTNVCYLTNGDGNFTVQTPGDQIYFPDANEATFTAYYPWNDLTGAGAINADTRKQTSQKSFDFLWAQASGRKDSPRVDFTFAHRMAKVVLTVKRGDGMSYDEVKNARLSLGGFRHTGTFDINNGRTTVNVTADNAGVWAFTDDACKAPASFNETDNTVTYSLLFFPQEFVAPLAFTAELPGDVLKAGIDFTAANREKDGDNAKNEWVAGRQYNLGVQLHKTEITLGECVIKPWTEVKDDNIKAD